MTDQRSAFRFRVPRLRPSVPPPRPTTQTTARRPPPIRPQQQPPPSQLPTRPQLRPQGTASGPPPATAALPSSPRPPPPVRPQDTTPARPLPVVQPAPQAAAAAPPQVPLRPQSTTPAPPPTPTLLVTPSPPQEPAVLPPTEPTHPLGTVPASPPQPVVEPSTASPDEPALLKTPSPAPVSPPTALILPLGTVPASPPEPPVEPSAALIAPQDEPASITPKPTEAASSSPLHSSIMPKLKTDSLPSSPSQTTIQSRFSSPPSPSRVSAKSPPPSQPSSPPRVHPSQPPSSPTSPGPQVKGTTEIASDNGQLGADPVLNVTPTTETNKEIHEEAFKELSSEHSYSETHIRDQQRIRTEENQHESEDAAITTSNIPNMPQTKSMISLPEDKIPVQESPEHRQPNGPQAPYCGEKMGTNLPNHDSNEKYPSVITLAGENRGTTMHLGSGATKSHWKIHIRRMYKVNPDEITDTTTDEEESSNEKKKENDLKPNENKEKDAYVNCNIQGINNSVVYNCSITESNPGVYLGSSSNPVKKPKINKVKVNTTPSQSQKHTIRRRCLRGLFMESSSDSDQNNPQKPRRHGCRYKSNEDDKIDVV